MYPMALCNVILRYISGLLFLLFPCCLGEVGNLSHRSTPTVLLFQSLALWCWSIPHYYPPAFLRCLFRQSSHLGSGLPGFPQPSCYFISALFCNISALILTKWPAHIPRLFNIYPTKEASVPISSLTSFIITLSTLFTPSTKPNPPRRFII